MDKKINFLSSASTWTTLSISLFLILIFRTNLSLARGPAVEPVRGIPIDEFPQVSPHKSNGFKWSKTNQHKIDHVGLTATTQTKNKKHLSKAVNNGPVFTKVMKVDDLTATNNKSPVLGYILFILLPFAIWFGFIRDLFNQNKKSKDEMNLVNPRLNKKTTTRKHLKFLYLSPISLTVIK